MAAARKSTVSLIPKEPRLTFRGELQSQGFTRAAYAVFAELARIGEDTSRFEGRAHLIETVFDELQQLLQVRGDAASGALAGIASYFAEIIDGADVYPEGYEPLEPDFEFEDDVAGRVNPPKQSLYFEVCGAPISATPDHRAYSWDAKDAEPTSIELVRGLGKPISREKFDRLRARRPAREGASQ